MPSPSLYEPHCTEIVQIQHRLHRCSLGNAVWRTVIFVLCWGFRILRTAVGLEDGASAVRRGPLPRSQVGLVPAVRAELLQPQLRCFSRLPSELA